MKCGLVGLLLTLSAHAQIPAGVQVQIPLGRIHHADKDPTHSVSTDPVELAPSWPQQLGEGVTLSIGKVWVTTEKIGAFCVNKGSIKNFPIKGEPPNAELDISKVDSPSCCFAVDVPDRIINIPPFEITLGAPLTDGDRGDAGVCWKGTMQSIPVYSIAKASSSVANKQMPSLKFYGFTCITPIRQTVNKQVITTGIRPARGDEIRAALRRPAGENILNKSISVHDLK